MFTNFDFNFITKWFKTRVHSVKQGTTKLVLAVSKLCQRPMFDIWYTDRILKFWPSIKLHMRDCKKAINGRPRQLFNNIVVGKLLSATLLIKHDTVLYSLYHWYRRFLLLVYRLPIMVKYVVKIDLFCLGYAYTLFFQFIASISNL